MTNEAFSRVQIDAQLKDQGREVTSPNAVRYETEVHKHLANGERDLHRWLEKYKIEPVTHR
jgi:hypothetical protein